MANLQFITNVQFGFGDRRLLVDELRKAGSVRPLFVTDKGVLAAGVFGKATESIPGIEDMPVFSDVPVNPTEAAALAGATLYRHRQCDAVVGIGGGASLDLAKAIAILATNPGPLWNYCNRHANPAAIIDPPPLILLPTTSGTGSEVGRSAVIVFDNGIKAGVRCPDLVTTAICDPELTLGLPPGVTASTGMDALSHCIETYCSPAINPPSDAIALDGMKRLFDNIELAVADGGNRDARWNMMMGSLEGAICFQKGMGAVHALSHPLGALGHHHGTLNAILLPHVLAYNLDAIGDKAASMARQAGIASGKDLPALIHRINAAIKVPARLRDLGIERSALEEISKQALLDNAHKTNPRKMAERDYLVLLEAAF